MTAAVPPGPEQGPGKAVVAAESPAAAPVRSPEEVLTLAKKLPSLAEASFGELMLLAQQLVPTGFLPDHVKTPGQCVAIILAGRELGMPPMRALRSIQLVKGKITENADSMLARFKSDGGKAKWQDLTETRAVLFVKHPNGDEHTETFTMQDADRAGLTKPTHRGEPSMFTKYPKAMLRSRAITAALKSIGWEGGAGAYDPDELAIPIPSEAPAPGAQQGEPAPTGTWQRAPDAPPSEPEKPIETLEQALELIVPGGPTKWGGHGGKKFSECGESVLKSLRKWADKLITEAGSKGEEPEVKVVNWKRGAELVLKSREQPKGEPGESWCCDKAAQSEGSEHDRGCENSDDLPF